MSDTSLSSSGQPLLRHAVAQELKASEAEAPVFKIAAVLDKILTVQPTLTLKARALFLLLVTARKSDDLYPSALGMNLSKVTP